MNVLLINHEMNMGGASKSLVTLASELKDKGHNVVVILPLIKGQVLCELRKKNIQTHLMFFGWRVTSKYWNPIVRIGFRMLYLFEHFYVKNIISVIRRYDIEIIHSNSSVIDIGAKAAIKTNIPHIWHYRESQDFYGFSYIPNKKKRLYFLNKVKGKVVFISHSLYEYYNNEVPENIGKVIYNGISSDFLIEKYMNSSNKKKECVKFLLSGNFHRNKRHDIAISAAQVLYKKGYRNFELLLAGAIANVVDSEKYETELRYQAKDMHGIIKFLGFVDDMVELRKNTDVELVCSEQEAFGRVTVEAMMASNPVIASESGANSELVQDGINGFLFEVNDVMQLVARMQLLLDDTNLISKLGKSAYSFAVNNFCSNINTNRIEKLYRELIYED